MSHSKTPTLPWVLPLYEMMREHLLDTIAAPQQSPKISSAASMGLTKLDSYYFKAKFNQYNILATSTVSNVTTWLSCLDHH